MSPDHAPLLHTFNVSTPLGITLRALRTDAAATISSLSGGESVSFADRRSLELQLAALANDLPGRYALSFRPSSDTAGFHVLQVSTPGHPGFHVLARSGYWAATLPSAP